MNTDLLTFNISSLNDIGRSPLLLEEVFEEKDEDNVSTSNSDERERSDMNRLNDTIGKIDIIDM